MTHLILINGRMTTFDPVKPEVEAIAVANGKITATGTNAEIMALKQAKTKVIDLGDQRVIPGLIDSHTHIIRQGNNFAMELRWDRVPSLADGLAMLKAQAQRTPVGQWIRVVGRDKGLEELHWIFDHGETVSEATMERVARLGGGISYQNRIAFQATAYRDRYGEAALREVMPVKKMMASGVPLAAGTDATRVSSYNPWLAIHWAVSGKGRGGDVIWAVENRLSREDALRHWTAAGAWFSREQGKKGQLTPGQFADLAVLDRDYFEVPEEDIVDISADLTLTGGTVVHAKGAFATHAPAPLPELPQWSPVPIFGAPGAPAQI